jgi:hypothetical protein
MVGLRPFGSGSAVGVATGPDGGQTACYLAEAETSGVHQLLYNTAISLSPGTLYTGYWIAKAKERQWLMIGTTDAPSQIGGFFNLTSGVVGSVWGGATALCTPLTDGWWMVSLSAVINTASQKFFCRLAAGNNQDAYAGLANMGLYVAYAGLITGTPATPLIAIAGTVSRAAEVLSIIAPVGWYDLLVQNPNESEWRLTVRNNAGLIPITPPPGQFSVKRLRLWPAGRLPAGLRSHLLVAIDGQPT